MQNKPNLLYAQTNITSILTKDYENETRLWTSGKQTQSNPISKAKKMLVHLTINGQRLLRIPAFAATFAGAPAKTFEDEREWILVDCRSAMVDNLWVKTDNLII